jgi:hypothetical protein
VVATPLAAEGMSENLSWGGAIALKTDDFAMQCVLLHESEEHWELAKAAGDQLIQRLYDQKQNRQVLMEWLVQLGKDIQQHRQKNFVGAILGFHSCRSTKYFSKWIEEKNRSKVELI